MERSSSESPVNGVGVAAERSSSRRDNQMESESSRKRERKREDALVERERGEITTRVHKTRFLKSIIILPTHNGLLNNIIIVFKEIIWVRDLAKQLDIFPPPLQGSYFRVLKIFKDSFANIMFFKGDNSIHKTYGKRGEEKKSIHLLESGHPPGNKKTTSSNPKKLSAFPS